MKKTGAVLLLMLLLLFQPKNALAATENEQAQQDEQQTSEEEFEAGLQQTINGLNLYDLQKGLTEDETAQELLQSGDFTQTLIALGKGEKALDTGQIFAVLGRGLIRAVRENIQWMVQMILLCCVMSLLGAIRAQGAVRRDGGGMRVFVVCAGGIAGGAGAGAGVWHRL